MLRFKNHQIISGLKRCDEKVIAKVYRQVYPMIENLALDNKGTKEDAQDLLQDGMLIVFQKIREGNFRLHCKFSTYLYQVCKNIWFNELKRRRNKIPSDEENGRIEDIISFEGSIEEKQLNLYNKHFMKMSAPCKDILLLHIAGESISMIMKITGIRNKQHAFNKLYKCKKELINNIRSDPEYVSLKEELATVD